MPMAKCVGEARESTKNPGKSGATGTRRASLSLEFARPGARIF